MPRNTLKSQTIMSSTPARIALVAALAFTFGAAAGFAQDRVVAPAPPAPVPGLPMSGYVGVGNTATLDFSSRPGVAGPGGTLTGGILGAPLVFVTDPNAFTPLPRAGVAGPAGSGVLDGFVGAGDPATADPAARPGIAGPARAVNTGRVVFTNPSFSTPELALEDRDTTTTVGTTASPRLTSERADLLAAPSVRSGLATVLRGGSRSSNSGRIVVPGVAGAATSGSIVITNAHGRARIVTR